MSLKFIQHHLSFIVNDNINAIFQFHNLNIKTLLCYAKFIGIEHNKQRMFAIIFVRHIDVVQLFTNGFICLHNNELNIHLDNNNPIVIANYSIINQ